LAKHAIPLPKSKLYWVLDKALVIEISPIIAILRILL